MRYDVATEQAAILERIVHARDGRLFRVRFVVVERDGVLKGRVVSCELVQELGRFKMIYDSRLRRSGFGGQVRFRNKTYCLPAWKQLQVVKSEKLRVKSFPVSPYFNKFDFMTVIKIRAPSRHNA